jgi:hypothetical protein
MLDRVSDSLCGHNTLTLLSEPGRSMRINGNDILVDIYPGLQEPPDTTNGALVPTDSRDVTPSTRHRPSESGRESSDVITGAKSDASGRYRQDTVDIQKLNQQGTEIGRYERSHLAVAGMVTRGGPSHEYRLGSDGRVYALGGEVSLDINTGAGNSQKTLAKMEQVRRAALTPVNLSSADQRGAVLARYDIQRTDLETLDQQQEQALTTSRFIAQQKGSLIDTWV